VEHRVLSEHFGAVKRKLQEFARHFDIANHSDIKGYGREVLVREFLATHLPSLCEYLTGEILDSEDARSGQTDIIVQSKQYPRIPLLGRVHLAFADAVIAAIEVKSSLNTQHLEAALSQFRRIKALRRNVALACGPTAAKIIPIPCVLFAFKGPTKDTLINSLNQYASDKGISLNAFCPDMVIVLDRDYYVCKNDGWNLPPVPGAYFRDWNGLPHENLVGLYNYLNNLIQAHTATAFQLPLGRYFDKSLLR
jgi:hypothetical protein